MIRDPIIRIEIENELERLRQLQNGLRCGDAGLSAEWITQAIREREALLQEDGHVGTRHCPDDYWITPYGDSGSAGEGRSSGAETPLPPKRRN